MSSQDANECNNSILFACKIIMENEKSSWQIISEHRQDAYRNGLLAAAEVLNAMQHDPDQTIHSVYLTLLSIADAEQKHFEKMVAASIEK